MPRIVRCEAAKRDITSHFAYLGERAGLRVAKRFTAAVRATLFELSKMPEMGAPGRIQKGRFAGVRIWPVPGFRNYLIIYRPLADGLIVERVIHAAQDYQRILEK